MISPVVERRAGNLRERETTRSMTSVLVSAGWCTTSYRWRVAKLVGWIGRRGPTEWPQRSPDFSPRFFFL
jgi:hypothetical protein